MNRLKLFLLGLSLVAALVMNAVPAFAERGGEWKQCEPVLQAYDLTGGATARAVIEVCP